MEAVEAFPGLVVRKQHCSKPGACCQNKTEIKPLWPFFTQCNPKPHEVAAHPAVFSSAVLQAGPRSLSSPGLCTVSVEWTPAGVTWSAGREEPESVSSWVADTEEYWAQMLLFQCFVRTTCTHLVSVIVQTLKKWKQSKCRDKSPCSRLLVHLFILLFPFSYQNL